MDWNLVIQSIVAMLVITSPPDPAKVLLFNSIIDGDSNSRTAAALKVAGTVFIILAGVALGGAQVAELMGINLDAFSVMGGIVVAGLGFEMLYGGKISKTQGQEHTTHEPDEDSGLIMPLSIPLIAGPGAIVTTVTISTGSDQGMWVAIIGAACVALVCFVSFQWLSRLISRFSPRATALMLRIGGMLLATIGVEMLLGGLKRFFA